MTPTPTRTFNPLPFQDLEPHRFEDLVRQLAYELHSWKSLEATGRGGADEGLDIRAIEVVRVDEAPEEDVEDAEPMLEERLWTFQCKREKTLTPKRIQEVIGESLASLAEPPYGFVLAVACDVSKKARDVFREEMVARGINSFAIWAKGELEDMLFQPKNDRLLFAYFGISLQPRRRALSTAVRSEITKKKQLTSLIGEDIRRGTLILLRDPRDERYPQEPKAKEPRSKWLACRAMNLKSPGAMMVLWREFLAAVTPDAKGWDAILDYDVAAATVEDELRSLRAWAVDEERAARTPHDFWNEYIPRSEQMLLKLYRWVPLDRVVAIDPLGDGYYPIPHVLVEFDDKRGPFSDGERAILESTDSQWRGYEIEPRTDNRAEIFPKTLPDESGPSPSAFDNTSEATVPLSSEVDAKLKNLLQAVVDGRAASASVAENPKADLDRVQAETLPFREWRTAVALPVFSTFVRRLRAKGHSARVVVRPIDASDEGGRGPEWIELRVRLHVGSYHNPEYRAEGHLRITFVFGRWQMEVWPPSDDSRARYAQAPAPKVEQMTKLELEAQVISMLEQLKARGQ